MTIKQYREMGEGRAADRWERTRAETRAFAAAPLTGKQKADIQDVELCFAMAQFENTRNPHSCPLRLSQEDDKNREAWDTCRMIRLQQGDKDDVCRFADIRADYLHAELDRVERLSGGLARTQAAVIAAGRAHEQSRREWRWWAGEWFWWAGGFAMLIVILGIAHFLGGWQ